MRKKIIKTDINHAKNYFITKYQVQTTDHSQ